MLVMLTPNSPEEIFRDADAENAGPVLGEFELTREPDLVRTVPAVPRMLNGGWENFLFSSKVAVGDSEVGDAAATGSWV